MAFLEAIIPQGFAERIRPLFGGRERATILLGGAVAATVAVVAAFWLWGSGYAVLYAGLSGEEGGRAIAELAKLNIPYRITEGGRVIEVPASEVGRARLQLATRGVVKRDGDEWAILDNQSLGVSPFVEQVHYTRGIEAALSRTVGEVDGVVSAKVTLALPKQTDFLGDSPKPSASVLVRLRPGTTLTNAQVSGIVSLVASSVPGLSRDHVAVVDQSGAPLSADGADTALMAPQQLELTREINRRYEAIVTELLVPVLGRGNFRVSSDADIDFSQSKESLVKYGDSHILSEEENIHVHGAEGDQPIGIPGALSNRRPDTPTTSAPPPASQAAPQAAPQPAPQAGTQPPAAQPGAPGQTPPAAAAPPLPPPTDTHKTTNYDLDKTVQFLEHPAWRLRGINVAVLVNNPSGSPLPAERLQSINKLVAAAIGAGQNPHVTVVDLPFETQDAAGEPVASWWREPWLGAVGQNALFAVAGLFALFGGVFPLLRRLSAAPPLALAGAAPGSDPLSPTGPALPPAAAGAAVRAGGSAQDVFSIDPETVVTLVANDPARTAQVLRGWMAGDRSSAA